MGIQWQPELSTHNREVDGHHQEMFRYIHNLVEACKEERSGEVIVEMVQFLNRYVDTHFSVEEKLLSDSRSPELPEHLRQHEELRGKLSVLTRECAQDGVNLSVVTNTLKLTYLWLKDHIQTMDQKMIP